MDNQNKHFYHELINGFYGIIKTFGMENISINDNRDLRDAINRWYKEFITRAVLPKEQYLVDNMLDTLVNYYADGGRLIHQGGKYE